MSKIHFTYTTSSDTLIITGKGQGGKSSPNLIYRLVGNKKYELKDHLGNVRVVVYDAKIPTFNASGSITALRAKLLAHFNFYPFGLKIKEQSWSGTKYRFGYDGKENDPEFHNASMARFLSIDPLIESYLAFGKTNFHYKGEIYKENEVLKIKID